MATTRLARFGFVLAAVLCTAAMAKLPPLSDEAKAKAAEAAAKSAWGDKVAAYQLCKSEEAIAATYFADMKKAGKEVKPPVATPPCADPGPYVPAGAASAPPAAAASAASAPALAAKKP